MAAKEKYDPYREALVLEKTTVWPDEFANVDRDQRRRIEEQLHAHAAEAAEIEYVRLPTGFSRQITVTAEDLQRAKQA